MTDSFGGHLDVKHLQAEVERLRAVLRPDSIVSECLDEIKSIADIVEKGTE